VKRFRLSKAAENDLRRIWRKGMEDWGEAQAEVYLRALDACFHLLGEHPGMGHPSPEIREGYHSFPKGEHHIYYRPDGAEIFIARIRAQRMLPPKLTRGEGGAPS
jgi:toxin ParE1/3/4